LLVNRVLSSISSSPVEQRDMAIAVEMGARAFVREHWPAILKLARALFVRGRLDEAEIRSVLSRASEVKLNQANADYASDLVSVGKINFGPFTWADDTDGADLLDDYDLASSDDDDEVQVHYPFGKSGEVYIAALKDAQKAGGAVADYATKLLTEITAAKKQSYQPKRSRGYYGDGDQTYWRNDGYLRLL
jgi:hypothetical protein